jgi:predicted lipid-binding transport protein (Tim44 family)
MKLIRAASLALALASVLSFMVDTADARVGRGGSVGSRGSKTYAPPPSTTTAPKPGSPIERSMTQPGAKTMAPAAAGPGAAAAAPSRFGGGFGGLLLGGLLGAGLFGLLSGSGLFGGLSGLASFLGLLLQVGLIVGAIYLLMGFLRSRNGQQPALARASVAGGPGGSQNTNYDARSLSGYAAGGSAGGALTVGAADYDAFEKLLVGVQTAFGSEDAIALGDMTTPEMLSYLSRDLADNQKQGIRNELSDVKLLQGDLAEAWTENGSDYATVAMRFSMLDAVVDRASGEVLEGDRTTPQEATEIWTFRRDHREADRGWQLSAIQQA